MMGAPDNDEAVEASLLAAEAIKEMKELLETVMEDNRKREELLEAKLANLTGGMRKSQTERSRLGVMGRNAKRAGMTLGQWILHCEENNHPVMRMDRTIVNHSRGEWAPADSEKGRSISKKRKEIARRIPRDARGFAPRTDYESSARSSGNSHSENSLSDVEKEVPAASRGEVKPTRSGLRERRTMTQVGRHRIVAGDIPGDASVGKDVRLYEDERGVYILSPREPGGSRLRAKGARKRIRVRARKDSAG